MNLREAAQQALECLESLQGGCTDSGDGTVEAITVWCPEVIDALRAALAEPPKPASLKRGTTGRCTRKVCECEKEGLGLECIHLEPVVNGYPLWSGIPKVEPEGGGNLPPPLQVPPKVAAALTTADLAWLETRRLTKLWQELGQMRWAGVDEGWDRAIDAVRSRLNDECQAVLYWKLTADKSQATAAELLRKMQGVKYD